MEKRGRKGAGRLASASVGQAPRFGPTPLRPAALILVLSQEKIPSLEADFGRPSPAAKGPRPSIGDLA